MSKAYKITIVGDSTVGKTSFISQFAHKTFLDEINSYSEPVLTSIKLNNKKMYISLVDTSWYYKCCCMTSLKFYLPVFKFLFCLQLDFFIFIAIALNSWTRRVWLCENWKGLPW